MVFETEQANRFKIYMKTLFTGFVAVATIFFMMGLAAFVPVATAEVTLSPGDLVKSSESVTPTAVYYYGSDEKLHTFFQADYYMSWYSSWDGITDISAAELAALDLGANVKVRPGTRLVKRMTGASVYAVEAGGVLRHIADETAAEALYGSDWNTNILSIYDIVWANYDTSGADLDGTAHSEGQLVKPAGGADIYYVGADGWSKVADMDALTANRFNLDFVVETALEVVSGGAEITGAVAAYTDVAEISTDTSSAADEDADAGALSVSSANTPVTAYVSKGAQNAIFSQFDVSAVGGDVEVSKILISRSGLGYDADVGTVRLYVDGVQLGTDQSVNTNTHKITFKNLDWTIASGETETLFVKANVAASPSGTNVSLSIAADDITSDASSMLGLPLVGNGMQFSALSVGQLSVDSVSGSATVISGETDQELGCWNLNTTVTEDFYVDSIKFTNIGSAADSEALTFVLKQGSNEIGSAETMDNGIVFVDMSADPYSILKSKTKKVCLYGDIKAGITVSKTLIFQVAEAKHAVARGADSAGEVLITKDGATGNAFTAQSAKTVTISQGDATLAQSSAYAPATGGTFVKGVEGNKMAAYKLTAGATEGVKLTKLILTLAGTGVANTDFNNWTLFEIVDGAEVEIPVTGAVSDLTITFEDTLDGLLSVEKSKNKSFVVRADFSSSAAGTETGAKVYVGTNGATNTAARIKGLDSDDYITSGVTLSGVATGDAQTFDGGTSGDLVVSRAATSPSSETIAKDTTNVHFTDINLYATGEDVLVTDMQVISYADDDTSIDNPTATNSISNIRLEDEDGNVLGTTVATPAVGVASFSFSYIVPKETNKVISVFADVPSGTAESYLSIHAPGDNDGDSGLDNDDTAAAFTSTGVYSSADISETGSAVGNYMTVGVPQLAMTMGSTPIASSYVTNSTDVILGTMELTATTVEDVKVTSIKVSVDADGTLDAASSADTELKNVELIDATTGEQYGITKNLTSGAPDYATFSGINNLTVLAGETKSIYVRADLMATGAYAVGVADPNDEITGSGVVSLQDLDVTNTDDTPVGGQVATIEANGTLTISKDATSPSAKLVAVGSSGASSETTMLSLRAYAAYENMNVTKLVFTRSGGAASDFATNGMKLYHKVGTGAETLISSASMIATTATFNIASGDLILEKDTTNLLIVKALLNGTSNGVSANDAPLIKFGDNTNGNDDTFITAKGVGSNVTLGDDQLNSTAALNVANALDGNAQTLRKTKPTFDYVSVGSALNNAQENDLFSYKITADAQENVSIKQLKFTVTMTDNTGNDDTLLLGAMKLYRGTTNLTDNVTIMNADGDINYETADLFATEDTATTVIVTWATEETIPAGSSYTYTLKGTPNGFATDADNDYITVRLENDASVIAAVGYTYASDIDSDVGFEIVALADSAGANETAANIIWSDNSVGAHNTDVTDDADGAADVPGGSADWFNGFEVDTLPTSYATITR